MSDELTFNNQKQNSKSLIAGIIVAVGVAAFFAGMYFSNSDSEYITQKQLDDSIAKLELKILQNQLSEKQPLPPVRISVDDDPIIGDPPKPQNPMSSISEFFVCVDVSIIAVNADVSPILQCLWSLQALTISMKASFKEAPPTRKPSTSVLAISSAAFFSVTDPPYMMRILLAASAETFFLSQSLTTSWAYWA